MEGLLSTRPTPSSFTLHTAHRGSIKRPSAFVKTNLESAFERGFFENDDIYIIYSKALGKLIFYRYFLICNENNVFLENIKADRLIFHDVGYNAAGVDR